MKDEVASKEESEQDPYRKLFMGFRIVYAFMAWVLLGFKIPSGMGWFTSVFLYQTPFLIDYLGFGAVDEKKKKLKKREVIFSIAVIIIALLGCFGVLSVVEDGVATSIFVNNDFIIFKGTSFSTTWIWLILLATTCFNSYDYAQYSTKEEEEHYECLSNNVN